MSKGDNVRPYDIERYNREFDRIFKRNPKDNPLDVREVGDDAGDTEEHRRDTP